MSYFPKWPLAKSEIVLPEERLTCPSRNPSR